MKSTKELLILIRDYIIKKEPRFGICHDIFKMIS